MYNEPFQIEGKISNNAFSFSKRKDPIITIPSIIKGNIGDVGIGDKVVFEDVDENGKLKSCIGLRNFIRTSHPITKKPVIIADNHNHVFYFWYEARNKKQIKDGATLVHIDQHKDMRVPKRKLVKTISDDLNKVFEYTNEVLNVGNYIPPAMEEGLVASLISITSEEELIKSTPEGADHDPLLQGNVIVNIDLDFWAPEMNYIDHKLKIDITKKWMEKADLITIANSPFFIDQELALKVLKELFYNAKC
ncbi:UPF0489 family protein [Patescibacteria group bacterium]|nr:UPF0489 family protein [Patescibacteria group bacterium]